MRRLLFILGTFVALIASGAIASPALAASGDHTQFQTSTDFAGGTNACKNSEAFFRYLDRDGVSWVFNTGGANCVVKTRIRYTKESTGKGAWTAWESKSSKGWVTSTFLRGKRCWSEYQFRRNDGSYRIVRLFAPAPRSGNCDV